jgi:hypothetical protein
MERRSKSNHQPMEKHPFYAKDQIAAYLNGTMSDVQMEAFENLLDTDPFFEAIVEGVRLQRVAQKMLNEEPELLKGYDQINHDQMLSNIKTSIQQNAFEMAPDKTPVRPLHTRWTWKTTAAAAAVLLISMGTWTYQKVNSLELPEGEALATTYVSDKTWVDVSKISIKEPANKLEAKSQTVDKKPVLITNEQTLASNHYKPQAVAKTTPIIPKVNKEANQELQKLIAINKQEIKYWEDELSHYQTSRGADAVKVISPATGNELAAKEVVFEVKYEGKSTLLLTIYDARSMTKAVVMDFPLKKMKDSKTIKHVMKDLKKGTYYWKLTNEEEELFIGKFKKMK